MKLSALEITLASALEELIRVSGHQMVDEDGVMYKEDAATLKRARRAMAAFKKARGA